MEHAPDNTQPLLGVAEPWYLRWRGVFATIVIIAALETITRAFQVSIGSKNAFAALGVVYSAFVGGLAPGLVSAAISVAYTWVLLSDGSLLFSFKPDDWRRLLTFVSVVPTAAVMVGVLKSRADRAQRRLSETAVEKARQEASDSARAETRFVLEESEARYRQLFLTNQAVKLVIDPAGGAIVDANDAAVAFYNWPREKLLSMRVPDLNASAPDLIRSGMEAATREHVRLEFQHRLASGEVRHVEEYSGPFVLGGRRLVFSIIHDVTARKKAEDALRDAERTFRTLFETSPDGVMVVDPSTNRPVEVNAEMLRMLGYSAEEFRELRLQEIDVNESGNPAFSHIAALLATGSDRFETRLRRKDGGTIVATVRVAGVHLHGKPYLHAVIRDVTEERISQERLFEAHQRLAFHAENSPLAVIEWDSEYHVLRWSAGAERIFGWKAEEVLGRKPQEWRLVYDEDADRVEGVIRLLAEGTEDRNVSYNRNYTKDGAVVHCRWHNSARRDASGKLLSILSFVADVTAQEKAEAALRASEATNRALLQAMPDLMLRHSKDGVYLGYSCQPGTRLLMPPEAFLGRRMEDVLPPYIAEPALECLRRTLRLGGVQEYQYSVDRDGTPQHYEVRMVACGGDEVLALVRNITERLIAEERLRDRDALLQKLSEQVPGVIYQFRLFPDGRSCFPYASEGIRSVYGVSPEDVRASAEQVFNRLHRDDYDRIVESIQESARTLTTWHCEYRVNLPERGVRWLEGNSVPVRLHDGSTLWHGYISDVTDRHEANEALRLSEDRYRTLIEAAPEAIVVLDSSTGRFVDFNRQACVLFAARPEHLASLGPAALSPEYQPDGRLSSVAAAEYIQQAIEGQQPRFEWIHRSINGAEFPCEIRLVSLADPDRNLIRGSIADITERKRAEVALRETQELLLSTERLAHMGSWEWDLRTNAVHWSPETFRMYGLSEGDADRMSLELSRKNVHSDDLAKVDANIEAALQKDAIDPLEYRVITEQHGIRHLRGEGRVERDASGKPVRMRGFVQDITDRKRAEEAVRESKAILEKAQVVAHIGSWASDLSVEDGALVWSEECCRIFGVPRDRFDGKIATFFRHVHPDDLDRVKREAAVAHRDERHYNIDHRIVRADGVVRWVHQEGEVEHDAHGLPLRIVGVCQDITDRVAAEEKLREADAQLRQAQKMEAIGLLASGVAHDFNNLLSAIFTHISLTRATLHGNRDTATALDGLEAAAKQAEGVTRSLLAFARKGTSDKKPTELGSLVRGATHLLRATLPQNIRLVTPAPAPGLPEPWVLADSTQIQQIMINLALNARDAMEKGGTLRITASYQKRGPEAMHGVPVAVLSVSDTGVGISADKMSRVFEPFFTTKPGTENSGLGLAVVHGIVRDHGGHIAVESSPGRGATFHVYLPAIAQPAPSGEPATSRWRGSGDMVVLCVENRQVREIIATRLKRDGFAAVHCPGPDSARQALARHGREIRLAVIDADARGATALLSEVECGAEWRDARLIVLTPDAPEPGSPELEGRVITLKKPYQVSQLTDLIGAVLTRGPDSEEPAVERKAT